jgi:uncharacterized protein with ParB-like and HNH nuclease domain
MKEINLTQLLSLKNTIRNVLHEDAERKSERVAQWNERNINQELQGDLDDIQTVLDGGETQRVQIKQIANIIVESLQYIDEIDSDSDEDEESSDNVNLHPTTSATAPGELK